MLRRREFLIGMAGLRHLAAQETAHLPIPERYGHLLSAALYNRIEHEYFSYAPAETEGMTRTHISAPEFSAQLQWYIKEIPDEHHLYSPSSFIYLEAFVASGRRDYSAASGLAKYAPIGNMMAGILKEGIWLPNEAIDSPISYRATLAGHVKAMGGVIEHLEPHWPPAMRTALESCGCLEPRNPRRSAALSFFPA